MGGNMERDVTEYRRPLRYNEQPRVQMSLNMANIASKYENIILNPASTPTKR